MSKNRKTQSQPSPVMGTDIVPMSEETAENVIEIRKPKGERTNYFDTFSASIRDAAQNKVQTLSEAKQRLAEAHDYYGKGKAFEKEAREAADKAMRSLYRGRVNGAISADEISNQLGNVFGWKSKKDGSDSKTPLDQGEAIRKRVVRAVALHEHLSGGDGGSLFDGLSAKDAREDGTTLEDIHNRIDPEVGEDGKPVMEPLSLWSAYDYVGEIKRAKATRSNPFFDPSKVMKQVEALSEEAAIDQFLKSNALVAAYAALRDVLELVGQQAAAKAQAA